MNRRSFIKKIATGAAALMVGIPFIGKAKAEPKGLHTVVSSDGTIWVQNWS